MIVSKYIPSHLYGFVSDGTGPDVYFHLGDFDPGGSWPDHGMPFNPGFDWSSPPPIQGEQVDVVNAANGLRASRVTRVVAPTVVNGVVDSFDPNRGYGFVRGDNHVVYYLHRSEMVGTYFPTSGTRVVFFAGARGSNPRACYVQMR